MNTVITALYSDILQKIADQDTKAIELLYEQYSRRLYQYAVRQWRMDEDAAWDVLYQTLEQLIKRLPTYSFDNQITFDRFVFKVFLNFLRQRYRKDHNPNRPLLVSSTDTDVGEAENELDDARQSLVADWLIQSQEDFHNPDEDDSPAMVQLQRALGQLDPIDRDLLLLRAQEFSYEDIARMLGLVNNQLKVRHLRAKKKLIQLIDQFV